MSHGVTRGFICWFYRRMRDLNLFQVRDTKNIKQFGSPFVLRLKPQKTENPQKEKKTENQANWN